MREQMKGPQYRNRCQGHSGKGKSEEGGRLGGSGGHVGAGKKQLTRLRGKARREIARV